MQEEKRKAAMSVVWLPIGDVMPYENNPRVNDAAVDGVAESIRQFGWQQPIVVDKDRVIVVGHVRYKAAQKLGIETVPCIIADNLTEKQIKAYRLVDNKAHEASGWDFGLLDNELAGLLNFDMTVFGFTTEQLTFEPVSEDEIPNLDKKKPVKCPECGAEFIP